MTNTSAPRFDRLYPLPADDDGTVTYSVSDPFGPVGTVRRSPDRPNRWEAGTRTRVTRFIPITERTFATRWEAGDFLARRAYTLATARLTGSGVDVRPDGEYRIV